MQFSDTTNKTGLCEDIDFLCGSDSTSFPLADKARLINRYVYRAVLKQISVNTLWNFVDENTGKQAWSFADLVDGQEDYSLPTNILKLQGVSVLNSAGKYKKLKPFDRKHLSIDPAEYLSTDGLPEYYDVSGNSLLLKPAPSATDTTLTKGLKIFLSKEIDMFVSGDTTQEPPFPQAFHQIFTYGPAYEFLMINGDQTKAAVYKQECESMLLELGSFYSERNEEQPTRIRISEIAKTKRNFI
jgi:hypothetical protein